MGDAVLQFLAGGFAGAAATGITLPLDVIRVLKV